MTYNKFLYNTALWNAGRDEEAAITRSLIQAHTGPHIQAVVGGTGGVTLISDFVITDGLVSEPPTQFKFPDLEARIRAVQTTVGDVSAFIKAIAFGDLPASIFISNRIPDLPASIFGLFEANLLATLVGKLGEADLPATIEVAVAHLAAQMLGISAPNLGGTMFGQTPGNLGARIHAPLDLPAFLQSVQISDIPADIIGISFGDLPGQMLGIAAPNLPAFLRSFVGDLLDLRALTTPLVTAGLPATINPLIGPDDMAGNITSTGAYGNMIGTVKSLVESIANLSALVKTGGELDLSAIIDFFAAKNLQANIGTIPLGEKDRFFPAVLQPFNVNNLAATMTIDSNLGDLGATLLSGRQISDLNALIKVSETFITAILTVSTLASASLRATVGRPDCAGGSASVLLSAAATVQHAKTLNASLESFITKDMGASVNTQDIFFALDTIDFSFSPFKIRDTRFNVMDTINFSFSPFRGQNLGALITSVQNNVSLPASITATFPLPRVIPAVNVFTSVDTRPDRDQSSQELRLQLEGSLLEYIYVNGTEQSFIKDPAEDWKLNIRTFRPIAEGLFGDRAANRICKLGDLTSFSTLDQAVRFCIAAVLGFEDEQNLSATITATGQIDNLLASMGVSNTFGNLNALAGRVFPVDLSSSVTPTGGYGQVTASITITNSKTFDLGAAIDQVVEDDLGAEIVGL